MLKTKGARYSALLHIAMLVFLIFGLPDFFHRSMDAEPEAISVDILPIAPTSNVKNQQKAPIPPKPQPPKEATAIKETEATKAEEAAAKQEPEHVSSQDVVKPEPEAIVKKPEPKKEDKPKPKPKPKAKADDLDAILKSVEAMDKHQKSDKKQEKSVEQPAKNDAKSDNYDASKPMTMSEKDGIRNQVEHNWNVPAGAKDAQNLVVSLHIEVTQDGTVTNVELAHDKNRYESDTFFRAAVDSAIRAVREASPLKGLPPDKYGTWRDMEMNFDPKDML